MMRAIFIAAGLLLGANLYHAMDRATRATAAPAPAIEVGIADAELHRRIEANERAIRALCMQARITARKFHASDRLVSDAERACGPWPAVTEPLR